MSAVERRDHRFNENSPRPPIPGEETELTGLSGSLSPAVYSSWSSKHNKGGSSPVLTPRRSSLAYTASGLPDAHAPLGFEPEGSCSTAFMEVGGGSHSPPPYLRWACNLHSLLEDSDGVELFRRYLDQEGRPHADTLDFWFACEGLKKQQDPDKINQLVKVIYRRFFLKTQLAIPDDLRKDVNRHIKEGKDMLEGDVFDGVQAEVENLINETTYPNFLKSDMYLQHVQVMQNGELSSGSTSSGSSSGSSSGGGRDLPGGGPPLPTLHEDTEFVTEMGSVGGSKPPATGHDVLPLTKDMLMATQKRRALELRPKPEAYAGMYLQHAHYPFALTLHPHTAYSSYNPVSRQDSELQSLSSDARTESDNMSLKESSVDGGHSRCTNKKQYLHDSKRIKESARVNRDPYMHHMMIPRTQRQKEQVYPMKPEEFASILIEKLELVRHEQDAQEKLDRKLQEGELVGGQEDGTVLDSVATPHSLADAIREKLLADDDSDQAILDQHVSRVWSDLTPSRTPGLISPRPKSPEGRRRTVPGAAIALSKVSAVAGVLPGAAIPSLSTNMGLIHSVPHPYQSHSRPAYYPRHMRKEKDVFSTFSSDSGNVHDFPEGSEHKHHGGSGHMPKSKSMPDYQDVQKQDLPGHDFRFRQSRDSNRKSSSKKTSTELTDSGVSVVSDSTPVTSHPSTQCKDKVLSWLLDSDKLVSAASHCHSEREASKHRVRRNDPSTTSPVATRHSRKPTAAYSTSRSGSLERGSNGGVGPGGAWGPAQPFVADPSMPPLPLPHTATQLEEARRRLLEEEGRSKAARQRFAISSLKTAGATMHMPVDAPLSGQSTLRKSLRGGRSSLPGAATCMESSEFTTVVFSFCDEQFPYRTKIPGRSVTLRQFKEYLPKKGSYRYFFKTECDDLDMRVIQEEITDDNEILPLWEGKIMAQVKPVD
ncbi:axin isoform X2 [Zootermopsis nevadensis]|uniref:axin isoform X2 n=1 Tax=Zootermopsis nevadensis TaxID=136037 RepID=UPI000B8E66D8|nr:axin isoform X2 [Zootermopsis nevadensis]